jgi:hypothetical protein
VDFPALGWFLTLNSLPSLRCCSLSFGCCYCCCYLVGCCCEVMVAMLCRIHLSRNGRLNLDSSLDPDSSFKVDFCLISVPTSSPLLCYGLPRLLFVADFLILNALPSLDCEVPGPYLVPYPQFFTINSLHLWIVDFPALTWVLTLSLNSCLNPGTRALLENAALPSTTVLSFFVTCAL